MSEVYPRDMVGYGRTPPFADWPGGARVALQFVINYEEGGENNILHGDAASEAFLSEIVGAAPWPGHAPHEHGVDLRIRLARRLLAAAPHVHRARHAGHRLRRRHGDGAQPGSGRGDERGGLGDRHPRLQMDRLSRHAARGRGQAHRRGDPHPYRGRRRAAARLLSGPLVDQHHPARLRGGRLPLLRRHLRRRSALLDRGAEGAAADRALHARFQRHALRDAAGLQFRRPVLRLSQGRVRHALRRRRDGAEDAVDRPALPPGRPARRAPPRWRASSTTRSATTRCGSRPGSTSPATGSPSTRRRAAGSRRS